LIHGVTDRFPSRPCHRLTRAGREDGPARFTRRPLLPRAGTLLASCWPDNPGYANLFSSAPVVPETAAPCVDKQRRGQEPGDVTSSAPSRHARPAALDQRSPVRAVPQFSWIPRRLQEDHVTPVASWPRSASRCVATASPDDLPVIIEKSSGVVVDRLLGARHPVVPVHPTSFAARPRWGPPARTTPRTRSPAEWPRYRCWVAGRGPRRGRWSWTPAGPAGRGYTAGPAGGEVLGMLALAMHGRGWWTT
jgi:hypothetical protein